MKRTASALRLFLSATIFLQLFACKKGLVETQADPLLNESKQRSSLTSLTSPDVYVAGGEAGQAKYWKNGVAVTLPVGSGASGIVVVGTDVYACGSGTNPVTGISNAVYWVNGVPTYLAYNSEFTFATGIAVSGGDVYVTGRVGAFSNIAVYWKNGVLVSLGSGEANGIAASNGDIYIVNSESGNPSYWKNGTLVPLTGAPSNTTAVAIAASGSNVSVAGFSGGSIQTARLWKNGVLQTLSPTSSRAFAVALDAAGNPYTAGISGTDLNNQQIGYWYPGPDPIFTLSSGMQVTSMMGITVDQLSGDVYVCGNEYDQGNPPTKARYWVISGGSTNVVTLTAAGGLANAITLGQ